MLEGLKDALEHVEDLARENEKTEVVEICGHTYANKTLKRYDTENYAEPVKAATLSALADYIVNCRDEFTKGGKMIIHVVSPTRVRLMPVLGAERKREVLFEAEAQTSEFRFNQWYDQETFMICLQANFVPTPDLDAVIRLSGNIERKNEQTYSDDGRTQVATMTVGVASKADAIVPNPVSLAPYRTFQEIEQPVSQFVFRIGDKEVPAFKLVEAEGGLWKTEAVRKTKDYFELVLAEQDMELRNRITIIG